MGLLFEIISTVVQIISAIVVLVLSRHESPRAPLRPWVIGYLAGCVATLPFFYWLFPHRRQGVVSIFQEMQIGKLNLSFKRCNGSAIMELETPTLVISRLGTVADILRITLYFYFITWFVLGCIWISKGSFRAHAPRLYWSSIIFLVNCGLSYAVSFGFLVSAIFCCCSCLCCPCLIHVLKLIGLAE